MMAVSKSRRIDRIDGRTVLFLTLCACLVTFLTTSFLGHGIFTLWICLILCWFGLFRQAIGCFSIYMVALVWLLIEMTVAQHGLQTFASGYACLSSG